MVRLVFSIILFIILAVFVALNAQYTTTVNFFTHVVEHVSVAAVVTIALAVGVVYSFMLYVSNYFAKARSERLKQEKQKNKKRADELQQQAKEIEHRPAQQASPPPSAPVEKSKKRGLFRKRRDTDAVQQKPPEGTDDPPEEGVAGA